MTQRKSHHPLLPHKNPFHILAPNSCHIAAPVNELTSSDSQSGSLNRRKLKAIKQRGGKKNNWALGHYVPTSCTLSASNRLSDSSSSPTRHRWSKLACFEKKGNMPPVSKTEESNTLKCQARKVLRRIFSVHKSLSLSSSNLTTSQGSSSHSKPKDTPEDALDTPKPIISYPMKLHNTDLSFVTTQDPWETSVRSSSLRYRATLGTRRSEDRTSSRTGHRFSSCEPSVASKRLSFNIHHRASHDLACNSESEVRRATDTTLNRPTTAHRPHSSSQVKSSFDSKRSENHSILPNRGSLYRHPPVRPLSLSHHSRRNSALPPGDEICKRNTIHSGSRRSSMMSSNVTSTTNQIRQSWTTGRAVLDDSTPQGSAVTCSERSFVSTSGTDQKSVSSYCLPAVNSWAGVIEEDITVTLMGSPTSTKDAQKAPPTEVAVTIPPLIDPPKPAPTIASATSRSASSSLTPHQLNSCPTLPSVDISTPSTPSSPQPTLLGEFHRPLSLCFQPKFLPLIEVGDTQENPGSDWYAELMTTVEQTISKIN